MLMSTFRELTYDSVKSALRLYFEPLRWVGRVVLNEAVRRQAAALEDKSKIQDDADTELKHRWIQRALMIPRNRRRRLVYVYAVLGNTVGVVLMLVLNLWIGLGVVVSTLLYFVVNNMSFWYND